ncbi:MAG: hypothetical protein H7833_17590 [Magnetococcus sp. DMHC-1]|nr:hypothetical protein [Magnetococcales bacterium]
MLQRDLVKLDQFAQGALRQLFTTLNDIELLGEPDPDKSTVARKRIFNTFREIHDAADAIDRENIRQLSHLLKTLAEQLLYQDILPNASNMAALRAGTTLLRSLLIDNAISGAVDIEAEAGALRAAIAGTSLDPETEDQETWKTMVQETRDQEAGADEAGDTMDRKAREAEALAAKAARAKAREARTREKRARAREEQTRLGERQQALLNQEKRFPRVLLGVLTAGGLFGASFLAMVKYQEMQIKDPKPVIAAGSGLVSRVTLPDSSHGAGSGLISGSGSGPGSVPVSGPGSSPGSSYSPGPSPSSSSSSGPAPGPTLGPTPGPAPGPTPGPGSNPMHGISVPLSADSGVRPEPVIPDPGAGSVNTKMATLSADSGVTRPEPVIPDPGAGLVNTKMATLSAESGAKPEPIIPPVSGAGSLNKVAVPTSHSGMAPFSQWLKPMNRLVTSPYQTMTPGKGQSAGRFLYQLDEKGDLDFSVEQLMGSTASRPGDSFTLTAENLTELRVVFQVEPRQAYMFEVNANGHASVPKAFWQAFLRVSKRAISLSRVVGLDGGAVHLRDLEAVPADYIARLEKP